MPRSPRVRPGTVLLGLLVALWSWWFSHVSLIRHRGYWDSAYDVGLYDQGVWLLSRFKAPFVTLMGRNLLGDHTSFILLPLVPLYRFGGIEVLYVAQSLCIALGAVFVFRFAAAVQQRHGLRDEHRIVPFLSALVFLAHPALGWSNLENFHPDSALALLVPACVFLAYTARWRWFWFAAILAVLTKEDVSLVLLPLGVWIAFFAHPPTSPTTAEPPSDGEPSLPAPDLRAAARFHGLALALVAVSATLVMMFLVMRSLIGVPTRNAWRIPFGGPSGFLRTLFTDPLAVIGHLFSEERPKYLAQMLLPTAAAFLTSPSLALVSALTLGTNILSTFWYQYNVEYHYSLVVVPCLVMGSVWSLLRLRRPRLRAAWFALMVAASLFSAFSYGPLKPSATLTPQYPSEWSRAADELVDLVDDRAPLSAHHSVTTHLTHREEIYMFPTPFRATLYGVADEWEGKRLPAADRIQWVLIPAHMEPDEEAVWAAEAPAFDLVRANEHWRLFRRVTNDSLTAP